MFTYTHSDARLVEVLKSHGIGRKATSLDTLTDEARSHGVLYACHGCGSIGVTENGMTTEDYYAACADGGRYMRQLVADIAECCGDAHSTLF